MRLQLCDEQLGQPSRVAQRVMRVQYTCLVAQWVATASYKEKDTLRSAYGTNKLNEH